MMLADAARSMKYSVTVLSETEKEPAISHADDFVVGRFNEESSFLNLFSKCDVIAFESEFSNTAALKKVADKFPHIVGLHLSALDHLADKLRQKQFLVELGIPTAAYSVMNGNPETWLKDLKNHYPQGCMLKWAKGGYDGKGNFLWRYQPDLHDKALEFVSKALEKNISIYGEELVVFEKELAVVTARSVSGESVSYPTVITVQGDGICLEAFGPAVSLGLPSKCANRAEAIAKEIGNKVGLYGVFAVEFFYTPGGDVLVNEIAPRVHNSGHFSLGAAEVSQFTAHWLGLLGEPLPPWGCKSYVGMLNVLGPAKIQGEVTPLLYSSTGIVSYWYEKRDSRPGRKMGHMVIFANSQAEFDLKWAEARSVLKEWHTSYNS
jgi:phosphoribosylaminoimidazole carboxylase PurK protein